MAAEVENGEPTGMKLPRVAGGEALVNPRIVGGEEVRCAREASLACRMSSSSSSSSSAPQLELQREPAASAAFLPAKEADCASGSFRQDLWWDIGVGVVASISNWSSSPSSSRPPPRSPSATSLPPSTFNMSPMPLPAPLPITRLAEGRSGSREVVRPPWEVNAELPPCSGILWYLLSSSKAASVIPEQSVRSNSLRETRMHYQCISTYQ